MSFLRMRGPPFHPLDLFIVVAMDFWSSTSIPISCQLVNLLGGCIRTAWIQVAESFSATNLYQEFRAPRYSGHLLTSSWLRIKWEMDSHGISRHFFIGDFPARFFTGWCHGSKWATLRPAQFCAADKTLKKYTPRIEEC